MIYWICTILLFTVIVIIGIVIWKKGIKDRDLELDTFIALIVGGFLFICIFIPLAIDLPSALSGGQELFVSELPTVKGFGRFKYIETDNEELKQLNFVAWDMYEKYGNYRIKYTKHNKYLLDIELLD